MTETPLEAIKRHAQQILDHRDNPTEDCQPIEGCAASMCHHAEDILRLADQIEENPDG